MQWIGAVALAAWAIAGNAQESGEGPGERLGEKIDKLGQPVFMSPEWAREACAAWNSDPVLTQELVESGWVDNNGDRGFKVLHVYRRDCNGGPSAELRISKKGDMAQCTYGGAVETGDLDRGTDYVMYADTNRWQEMGRGDYGPMRAMMFGRLKFEGPKMEAMGNMGPFSSFLRLVGQVPGDMESCPSETAVSTAPD